MVVSAQKLIYSVFLTKWEGSSVEILGCSNQYSKTKQLVTEIVKAINNGIDPVPVRSGLGGAYSFRNFHDENIAIVKPTDEEPYAPNNPKGFVGKALGQPGLKRELVNQDSNAKEC
ncbi:hypothetical protein L484_003039 [Morus notabilis]|uniref:1-phosphatidylinositol 4-kinase n=1 Tax=Morus notabilis TaxID=981085 RepID=W9S441_9ROSA|nr:hypothetical protein L484_003039 [Morus notabilis]